MNPKLQKVTSVNNRQVLFTFSEELDTVNLKQENFTITSAVETNGARRDTLKILTLYPFSSSEIIVATDKQTDKNYEAAGYVFDKEENRGVFKKTFIGSARPDTIPPWLINYSKGPKNSFFNLQFAVAMDTTSFKFYIIPKKNLIPNWLSYRNITLMPETSSDSLKFDTTYYLYVKDIRDVSGNALTDFITSITPDTVYRPLILRGKAMVNDTLVKSGLAIIKREFPIGISRVDKGEFAFEVRDSLKFLVVVIAERYYGNAEISVLKQDTVILKPGESNIDTIIN